MFYYEHEAEALSRVQTSQQLVTNTQLTLPELQPPRGSCVCVCVCVLIIYLPVGRFLTEKFSNVTQLCRRDRQRQRTDTADLLRRHTGEKSPNLT